LTGEPDATLAVELPCLRVEFGLVLEQIRRDQNAGLVLQFKWVPSNNWISRSIRGEKKESRAD
jgi:hypothetical protein